MNKQTPFMRVASVSLALLAIMLIAGSMWLMMYRPRMGAGPTWNGIAPGTTSLHDAILILGQPHDIEDATHHPSRADSDFLRTNPGLRIYIYRDEIPEWRHVELWTVDRNGTETVAAILLTLREIQSGHPLSLDEIVSQHGKPDIIAWTFFPSSRYLIWQEDGLAVMAQAIPQTTDYTVQWSNIGVHEILYFAPGEMEQPMHAAWPWPNNGAGWTSDDTYSGKNLDFSSDLPLDPYDWSNLP